MTAVVSTSDGMGLGPATAERASELLLHGTYPGVISADRQTARAKMPSIPSLLALV